VALQQAGTTQLTDGTTAGPVHSIFALGGTALLAILLTGGAALGWLVSFILFAALVIVVVVLILIVRQAAIVLLVILSPVAILFYMLPNTESYFKKWRQTLLKLLIMYPMIVLLFASGKIFGIILQQPGWSGC
jgi:type IV secretory pathway VirB6-like protein